MNFNMRLYDTCLCSVVDQLVYIAHLGLLLGQFSFNGLELSFCFVFSLSECMCLL